MRTVAIIQARMGSSRLPGKVLKDIGGNTMLALVVKRTRRATLLSDVVVATSTKPADEAIVEECHRLEVPVFRGSEKDVLDRYYLAAQAFHAYAVMRITSDCPIIDPEIIDQVLQTFQTKSCDYASNGFERTFPRGLDCEVMKFDALYRAWREASEFYERVHVTPYIYCNPQLFRLEFVKADSDYGRHRWTVDTPEDLEFVRQVYANFEGKTLFSWTEVLALLERQPELTKLNYHIRQKDLKEG